MLIMPSQGLFCSVVFFCVLLLILSQKLSNAIEIGIPTIVIMTIPQKTVRVLLRFLFFFVSIREIYTTFRISVMVWEITGICALKICVNGKPLMGMKGLNQFPVAIAFPDDCDKAYY